MKAEDTHGFPQAAKPVVGEYRRLPLPRSDASTTSRSASSSAGVRGSDPAQVEFVFGLTVQDLGGGRGGSRRVDDAQRPAVGLVGAGRLARHGGEGGEFVADLHQPRRHRQFLLERGDLGEVVRRCAVYAALPVGQPHHVGGDVGVAVAVAADPGARPQDGFGQQLGIRPARLQRSTDLGVDRAGRPRRTPQG